jgi:predicted dienelactone hydrolase
VTVTLWYPAENGGTPVLVGDNAVFAGVAAQEGAPVADGRFPVVLIAHGGLRSAPNLGGWIASRLAAEGFLAAVARGPALGPGDAMRAPAEIWRRPGDLASALTALAADPAWSDHVDAARVGALGFFLGGTSVLMLAGGRLSADALARSCDRGGHGSDCAWFAANGVDLGTAGLEGLDRSYRDERIRAVVAVAPEYSASLAAEGFAGIAVPVEVVTLGGPDAVPPGVDASAPARASALVSHATLPDATRFDAFSLCKPEGAAILAAEGGDAALCRDGAGDRRRAVHDALATLLAGFLREHLGAAP